MKTNTAPAAVRQPGRPREEGTDRAILDATVELLKEQGFTRLTMAAIAERAGVGKPTVYRRWPSKAELVVDAIDELIAPITARRTGDPHIDLARLLTVAIHELTSPPLGPTMITLLADMHTEPELAMRVQQQLAGPRRAVMREVVDLAIADGQLRPGTDADLVLDMLLGPMLFRWLTAGKAPSSADVTRIVAAVWRAFAAAPASGSTAT